MSHTTIGLPSLCYAASVFSSRSPAVTRSVHYWGRIGRSSTYLIATVDGRTTPWGRVGRHWQMPTRSWDWPKTERGEACPSGPDTSVVHGSFLDTKAGCRVASMLDACACRYYLVLIPDPRDGPLIFNKANGISTVTCSGSITAGDVRESRGVRRDAVVIESFGPLAWLLPSA